jgi:hypothetical protein
MKMLSATRGWLVLAVFGLGLVASGAAAAEKQGAWKPLWDGKTLEGWHKIGVGQWTIEDGAIVGRKNKEDPNFGHLVTDKVFADFTARLKFKVLKGNSGFYFRIEEKGSSGVSGFQAEIEPGWSTGGLYETNGRAWVVQPKPEVVKKAFKPTDWNEMVVSAHGGDITVTLNGVKTAELKNDPGKWRKGHLALQLHGGNDMLVMFKDIEIRQ